MCFSGEFQNNLVRKKILQIQGGFPYELGNACSSENRKNYMLIFFSFNFKYESTHLVARHHKWKSLSWNKKIFLPARVISVFVKYYIKIYVFLFIFWVITTSLLQNENTSANREPCNHSWAHQNTSSGSHWAASRAQILQVWLASHQILEGRKSIEQKVSRLAAEDLKAHDSQGGVCVCWGWGGGLVQALMCLLRPWKGRKTPIKARHRHAQKQQNGVGAFCCELPALCAVKF